MLDPCLWEFWLCSAAHALPLMSKDCQIKRKCSKSESPMTSPLSYLMTPFGKYRILLFSTLRTASFVRSRDDGISLIWLCETSKMVKLWEGKERRLKDVFDGGWKSDITFHLSLSLSLSLSVCLSLSLLFQLPERVRDVADVIVTEIDFSEQLHCADLGVDLKREREKVKIYEEWRYSHPLTTHPYICTSTLPP